MPESVGDVLLGSVPRDSAADVFKTCADSWDDHNFTMIRLARLQELFVRLR
jgi:hypothetical protein